MDEWHDARDDIRAAGLRSTTQRVAVLEVLREVGGHRRVGEVDAAVRSRLGTVSPQAVYDALDALARHGLAQRIEPAGSPSLYEATGRPHRHAVCRRCGAVADVELRHEPPDELRLRSSHGWDLDDVEITFWGLCPRCATRP